jgi:hypothetical protein
MSKRYLSNFEAQAMAPSVPIFRKPTRNSGLLLLPREARIHQIVERSYEGQDPITPKLLGWQWKGLSSELRIQNIPSPSLRGIHRIESPASIIADLESRTGHYLSNNRIRMESHLDFYGSGTHRSRRYNIPVSTDNPALSSVALACREALVGCDDELRAADRVISHLDYFPKNFIRHDGKLYIIDWGESYIGRRGFDAGAYLSVLFRYAKPNDFIARASSFLDAYFSQSDGDQQVMWKAAFRVFLPRAFRVVKGSSQGDQLSRAEILSKIAKAGAIDGYHLSR